jgi:hypothetical protein
MLPLVLDVVKLPAIQCNKALAVSAHAVLAMAADLPLAVIAPVVELAGDDHLQAAANMFSSTQ